jgi:hypothetical protein
MAQEHITGLEAITNETYKQSVSDSARAEVSLADVQTVAGYFKQDQITKEQLEDWVHFVWDSEFVEYTGEDREKIPELIRILEELEDAKADKDTVMGEVDALLAE